MELPLGRRTLIIERPGWWGLLLALLVMTLLAAWVVLLLGRRPAPAEGGYPTAPNLHVTSAPPGATVLIGDTECDGARFQRYPAARGAARWPGR